MAGFRFATCPRLVCEQGGSAQLGSLASELGLRHAFVVTDRFLHDQGLLEPALERTPIGTLPLARKGRSYVEQAKVPLPGAKASWDEWVDAARKVARATQTKAAMAWDRSGHRFAGPAISNGAAIFDAKGRLTAAGTATIAPVAYSLEAQRYGAGEIVLQSRTRDGTMNGFDLDVIEECSSELLRRKHPTGAVARLVEQSIEVARLQKTDRTIEQWSPDEQ